MYIINADDWGKSAENNKAILEAAHFGILNSTSVMINTPYRDCKIIDELLSIKNFRVGIHLNIFEFRTLKTILKDNSLLYDKNGLFNNGFLDVLKKSFNKEFLQEVEEEYRLQIEECLKYFTPTHIDSHVHMHAIPPIFNLVCKLAREYNIPYVRTQFEIPYFIPDLKMFSKNNLINLIKVSLLDFFTIINRFTLKKYNLSTNERIVGVQYTGNMDVNTLYCGYKANFIKDKITEALLHLTVNKDNKNNYIEYQSLLDEALKLKLSEFREQK